MLLKYAPQLLVLIEGSRDPRYLVAQEFFDVDLSGAEMGRHHEDPIEREHAVDFAESTT
jgi:hypothetical protein